MIIKGKHLMVFIGGKSIAYATNHTLSLSSSNTEISHKDISGLGTAQIVTTTSWSMTTENLYSTVSTTHGNQFSDLFSAWKTGTAVDIVMGNREGTPSSTPEDDGSDQPSGGWTPSLPQYSGKAYVTSIELNAPDGDNASYSVTFTGTGDLQEITL